VSSDNRGPSAVLLNTQPQAKAASVLVTDSQGGHVLDELKENISPLIVKPQNPVLGNVVECGTAGSHLLIVEDMGTPIRRTTFVKDADHCSPKYVTRTPERRIVNVSGFQSNSSSPQAVPDCYGTPLRRTTFVKNSPTLKPGGHLGSSSLFGKLQRNSDGNVEVGVRSHILLESGPETSIETHRQHLKSNDPLRDVSRSPLILEDRLLHLQEVNQSRMLHVERPRSTSASDQVSPSESEYHTAVTTPYDESLSEDEDGDEFLDSNVCSETIAGDMSLCQKQLALKFSSDITYNNNDHTLVEDVGAEALSTKPVRTACVDYQQANDVSFRIDEYEVRTELVTEVLESELHLTEVMSSLNGEVLKPNCVYTPAELDTAQYHYEMTDFENIGKEQQFLHSNGCVSSADDVCCSVTQYQSTPLLNNKLSGAETASHATRAPVIGSKLSQTATNDIKVGLYEERVMHPSSGGIFRIPTDASCSFNGQTFNKVCATPTDVLDNSDSNNRTYTKSAGNKVNVSLSGSRPASRPLFTDNMAGANTTEDVSADVVPLDVAQSDFHDTEVVPPQMYNPSPTKPELVAWNKPAQLCGLWSDGGMSVMESGVFSHVGGQTRHMISPGQKRQSLIARLHGNIQHPSIQPNPAVLHVEHSKMDWLEGDGSPVRKKPLIVASKPCEYCF